MGFAIVEISENSKIVIDFVDSVEMFIYNLKKIYPKALCVNYMSPSDIEKYDHYINGLYILTDNNIISLLEKQQVNKKGFFYNTILNKINIMKKWEYIELGIIRH
jgi:hypothetical protein